MESLWEKKEQCCGCGACKAVCVHGAIAMVMDREGFFYPEIDNKRCVRCGNCKEVCPIKGGNRESEGQVYVGAQAKDDEIRFSSSSGGVFPVLAKWVLKGNGVVFGAAMNKSGKVFHRDIQDAKDIIQLQKSKYVQSHMSDCYEKVKNYLEQGRQVMFTGTPCQCQAMRKYIGKEHEKLLLVDLICYGVPSPGIWKKYRKELKKKYHEEVFEFCFRDKRKRDNGHTVVMKTAEGEHACPMDQDLFCRLYFGNYILRPSCHACRFCTVERESDLTIGDFWGIEKAKPEMDDGMGTSLIILHNEKAGHIWDEVKKEFRYFSCEKEAVLQPRLCGPALQASGRQTFWLLNRFLSLALTEKILGRIDRNR